MAVESPELWGAVGVLASAIAGGITIGSKFLARHFERRETSSEKFLEGALVDQKAARVEFREELAKRDTVLRDELQKRDQALEASRTAFTRTLDEHAARYTAAIHKIESERARERNEDRQERAENRRLIERLARIDTGSFKVAEIRATESGEERRRQAEQKRRPTPGA